MSTFPDSLLNASFVTESSSGDEDELMPWEHDDFVPRTSSGRQRSPNNIRNQLQRYYMDGSLENETAIIESMGISYDDFYEFMNPSKAYKTNQWAALENKTYWAAARWLEHAKHEAKMNHQASKKRKTFSDLPSSRDTVAVNALSNRGNFTREHHRAMTPQLVALVDDVELPSVVPDYDSSREVFEKINEIPTLSLAPFSNRGRPNSKAKDKAQKLMDLVNEVELPSIVPVYDSCPEVAKKISDFLKLDGVTKISFCDALAVNQNSLNTFLAGENQDQCGNITYRRAYVFFEKRRILEGEPKSPCRRRSEKENPMGYSLKARGFSMDLSHLAVAGLLEWAWGPSRWSDDTSELCH